MVHRMDNVLRGVAQQPKRSLYWKMKDQSVRARTDGLAHY